MSTVQQLREKRANIWEQMKDVIDLAEREGRELTGEERAKWDAAEKELDDLGGDVERLERAAKLEKSFESVDRSQIVPAAFDKRSVDGRTEQVEKFHRAFGSYLRSGMADLEAEERKILMANFTEARALGGASGAAGGYTVPPAFRQKIVETMKTFGGMLQVAEVITTDSGAPLQWPTNDDTSNVGAILAENTQMAEQDLTLGTATLDAYMYYSKLVRVSLQLLQDSAFDVEGFLARKLGERVGRILNQHFTTGTGSSQPDGLATNVTVGKTGTTGQTTTIIYDDLIDLIDSIDPAYAGNAQFMLSQASRKMVRKLKDTTGQPLWQPSIQAGAPDRLLGYDYVINQDLATPAANAKSILFGDFREAYVIRLVSDLSVIRLNERFADYLQVAFAAYQRADGTLQNAAAVRAYAQSAT